MAEEVNKSDGKLGLLPLTALVVSALIAAGVFSLPQNMAAKAGAGAILIVWTITGLGMLALVLVFQNLANRKSDIDGGVYGYARQGFGDYWGFNSAWGYWISAWLGNVSYYIVIFSTLGSLFGLTWLEKGLTWEAIAIESVILWLIYLLICAGVQGAAFLNLIGTIAKAVPLFLFVILVTMAFNLDTFKIDFWNVSLVTDGQSTDLSVLEQVKSTMLVTTWVFIGIEGAVMFSDRARNKSDVGKATIIGYVVSLLLFVAVSILSLGVLAQPELATLPDTSTADVLKAALGGKTWGATLMYIGLIISVGTSLIAWTLLCAQSAYSAGKDGTMPKFLGKVNKNNSPKNALLLTTVLTQVFLLIAFFAGQGYLDMLLFATTMILIPYLLSGLFGLKIAFNKDGYLPDEVSRAKRDVIIGAIASVYGVWLLYAAGLDSILVSMTVYAFGIIMYVWARREQGKRLFSPIELAAAVVIILLGLIGAYKLMFGSVQF